MLHELFQPLRLGSLEIKNRIVMPAMVTLLANENGAVTERMIDYYTERAKGGVGLIIVESAYVREEDRDWGRLGIGNPQLQIGLSELAESIQEDGARVFLQLNHRGAALSIRKGKGPDEFKVEEIEILIEAFAHAARQAQEAGEFVSFNSGWQPHFYGAIFMALDTLSLSPSRSKGLAITPLKPYRLKSEKIGSLE